MTAGNLAAADDERGGLRPLPLGLAAGHSAGPDGTAGLGPGGRHAIGGLARGARGFATRIGLGFTARRAGVARAGVATDGLAVRPPVDFWPGGVDEPHPLDRVRTGDPAYDRLVNQRRASAAASAAAASGGSGISERVGRGLPASIHRRGRTVAGPRTAPGAGGMRPGEIRPAPNEATRLAPSSSTTAAGAGPRATAATGPRPRASSSPGSGGGRSAPMGGSGYPSGGSGRGGGSTSDDPGGADADLAALRAAIVARRNQQAGDEVGRTAPSSPVGADSSGERSPVRQQTAGARQVHADSGRESDSAAGSEAGRESVRESGGGSWPRSPRSAAEGLPVRHDAVRSPSTAAGGEPTEPTEPRPPSRPLDPRSSREASRSPRAVGERHEPAARPGSAAGDSRKPRSSGEIQQVPEPSHSRPGLTPDTPRHAPGRAADADLAHYPGTNPNTSSPAAATTTAETISSGPAASRANTTGPANSDTAPATISGSAADTATAAATTRKATTTGPAADVEPATTTGPAARTEPDTARATTSGPSAAGGGLARASAAEGLPVRFSGLVAVEAEPSPRLSGAVDPPTSPRGADRPTSGPSPTRPAPPDSLPPANGRPADRSSAGSVHAGDLPTGGEPIGRSATTGPTELRSAAEGLAVRGTALPAASGDHHPPPSTPGSSAPRSATSTTSGQRSAGDATDDLVGRRPASGRALDEHLTQGTVSDRPRPKNTSNRSPNELPSLSSAGVSEQVGDDLGGRFLSALGSGRPDRSTGLPGRFRPLARALTGGAPVRLVTGAATRRALDVVGSAAATVGRTIYLAEVPGAGSRHREILAHELVHAARPSPVPRFFADPRPSAEERLAHATGRRVAAGLPLVATSLSTGRSAAAGSRTPGPTTGSPPVGLTLGTGPALVHPGRRAGLALAGTSPAIAPTAAGKPPSATPAFAGMSSGVAPTSASSPQAPAPASPGAYRAAVPASAGSSLGMASAIGGTPLGLGHMSPSAYRAAAPVSAGVLRAAAPLACGVLRSADPAVGGPPSAGRSATASVRPTVGAGLRRAAVPLGAAADASARLGASWGGAVSAPVASRSLAGMPLATGHAQTPATVSATGLQCSAARPGALPDGRAWAGRLSAGRGSGVGPDPGGSISRHGGVLRRETSVFRGFRDTEWADGAISTPPRPPMGTAGLPVGGLSNVVGPPATSDTPTARRQTVHREQARRPGGDPTPGALATAGGGGGGPAAQPVVTTADQAGRQAAGGGTPPPTTGPTGGSGGSGGPSGQPAAGTTINPDPAPAASAFDDIDRLVELLEERLLAELERRGARFRGGPF